MVVMDIGGHVGYYSMLAARKTGPTGRVYTFEPDLANFKLLSKLKETIHKQCGRSKIISNTEAHSLKRIYLLRHWIYDPRFTEA